MQVDEETFYSLVQFFAIALFECFEEDDFTPAKNLMNMSFTYYMINLYYKKTNNNIDKIFVYEYLKDQPIFKSMRFWTASYFLSVQNEMIRSKCSNMKYSEVTLIEKNISFGQLGYVNFVILFYFFNYFTRCYLSKNYFLLIFFLY